MGILPALAQKPAYPFDDPTLPMEKRIDNLLSLMTIDEKIHGLGTAGPSATLRFSRDDNSYEVCTVKTFL